MTQKINKTPLIKTLAFLISIVNFASTVVSLLTTDMNLLSRRIATITGLIADYQYVLPIYFALSLLLVLITFSELKSKKIPHLITIPGIILGLILSPILNFTPLQDSLMGIVAGLVFFGGIFFFSKGTGLGFGVVMMEAMLGAFLGPIPLVIINAIAFLILLAYVMFSHQKKLTMATKVEFGPVLALATGIYLLLPLTTILLHAVH